MRNEYEMVGKKVFIILKDRSGFIRRGEIDLKDFDKVNNYDVTFFASYRKKIDGYYVCATAYLGMAGGKPNYKTLYLHRIIINVKERNIRIDHIDYNTLNNTRKNLRISSPETNSTNRSKANKNNKRGYRNVCEVNGKLIVQLRICGRNKILGRFEVGEIDSANEFAKEMRLKYYGDFSGENK
jgi:hypothetical protein